MRVTGEGVPASIIVLVGLPGAGKSTVGVRAARFLGAMFIDLDAWIERRTGRSVADIFATDGEAAFRRLERQATQALPADRPLVLAPGGGWLTQPELLESIADEAVLVWLKVEPAEAARRLEGAAAERPLLAGDARGRLDELLKEREPAYARARIHIGTDGRSPDAVVEELIAALRSTRDP